MTGGDDMKATEKPSSLTTLTNSTASRTGARTCTRVSVPPALNKSRTADLPPAKLFAREHHPIRQVPCQRRFEQPKRSRQQAGGPERLHVHRATDQHGQRSRKQQQGANGQEIQIPGRKTRPLDRQRLVPTLMPAAKRRYCRADGKQHPDHRGCNRKPGTAPQASNSSQCRLRMDLR